MTRKRSRDIAGPAVVLAGAGIVTGAAIGSAIARRHRRRRPEPGDAQIIARRLLEGPWGGALDVVDELVAEGYIGHDPADPEPVRGPAGVREAIERYRRAFPDATLLVDEQLVDGARVASRWTARGTHTAEIAGIAPTGRQATVTGVTVLRVAEGKAVEGWTSWDRLGLLVQLGAVSEPAHASG